MALGSWKIIQGLDKLVKQVSGELTGVHQRILLKDKAEIRKIVKNEQDIQSFVGLQRNVKAINRRSGHPQPRSPSGGHQTEVC